MVTAAIYGALILMMGIGLWQNKKKKTWEKFAADMGLRYQSKVSDAFKGVYSIMEGEYRKHRVEIYLAGTADGRYTGYDVHFENPRRIAMDLHKEGLFSMIEKAIGDKDITLNDPEFDRRYILKANNSIYMQTIMDQPIRRRIIDAKNFNLMIDEEHPYVAHSRENGFVTDAERLRSVLELMVDIVEKIEKA